MSYKILKAVLVHLRLPFSIFLAPVFLFALSEAHVVITRNAIWVFIILHLLLFPASNAYNSYYDQDEGSIGLIEKPPPATRQLLYTALTMDILAVILAILLNLGWFFTIFLLLYGLLSKAYSHPLVRLKQYPVASLLIVAVFQGFYTFAAVFQAISGSDPALLLSPVVLLAAALCTVNLLAVYPITQVYQHDEDRKHGDLTYSRLVGIRGTFAHAAIFFSLSFPGFGYLYVSAGQPLSWLLFAAFMAPALTFFLYWWRKVYLNESEANYSNTMRMNALASMGLNAFFVLQCTL